MTDYDRNVYYKPEACGLKAVRILDQPNLSYEYNTFIVMQHAASGRVFWAADSGCSCPTPFEKFYFRGPDETNMGELSNCSWDRFESEAREWNRQPDNGSAMPVDEFLAMLSEARRVIGGR